MREGGKDDEAKKKCIVISCGICRYFVVLISSFFVAAETNHDCTGEDCPICYEISVCQETVRKLTFACAVFAAILLLSVCIVLPVAQSRPAVCHTLISLKVKLSD